MLVTGSVRVPHSSILHILKTRRPSQVRDMVVVLVSVYVIHLRFIVRVRDIMESDETTYEECFMFLVSTQFDLMITLIIIPVFQEPSFPLLAPDSPIIIYQIVWISVYLHLYTRGYSQVLKSFSDS